MSIIGILSSNLFSAVRGSEYAKRSKHSVQVPADQDGISAIGAGLAVRQSDAGAIRFRYLVAKSSGRRSKAAPPRLTPATTATVPWRRLSLNWGRTCNREICKAAQQDYTNLQQDVQQSARDSRSEGITAITIITRRARSPSSSSSQQTNPIAQAFGTLAQDLQAGNLSGAQSAFATLQNDLQQIGGFLRRDRAAPPARLCRRVPAA